MFASIRKSLLLLGPARRRRFVLVGALSILVSGLEAVAALLVLVILRFVLEPGTIPDLPIIGDVGRWFPGASYQDLILWSSAAFAGFFVVRGLLFLFQQYVLARVAENTGLLLSDRLVDGYLSMPYEFHLSRNSSELIRNAYDNVQQIVIGVFTPLVTLVAEATMAIAMLAVLLVASVQVTVAAAFGIGTVLLLTLAFVQPRLKVAGRRRQLGAKAALKHLQQGLSGIRDIKILGKEATFSSEFFNVRRDMAEAQYERSALLYVPRVAMETAFLLLILGALSLAVVRNEVDGVLSTLGVFAYAGLRLQPSLQKIATSINGLKYTEAAIDDLAHDLDLLDVRRALRRHEDREPAPLELRETLALDNVHFRYAAADRDALDGLDLVIRRGESIGIAGATGGGKTTLLDVLCGLLSPTTGSLLVDGIDVRDHLRAWQRSLGVVHQNAFLVDDTLARNVALGVAEAEVDDEWLRQCLQVAQLSELVDSLPEGVATRVGERGVRLSGGQRQRITLARALYRRPSVLILDEGTAALDNQTERAVMDGIEALAGETTVIMVAHRLTTIENCDRIVYLEAGRVTAVGTFEDLVRDHDGFRKMTAHSAS